MKLPLMLHKPRLRGVVGVAAVTAACVGAGGTALAVDGASSQSSATAPTTSSHAAMKAGRLALARISHGQFTVKRGTGFVTRDVENGAITRLSTSSLTVRAGDGFTQTFLVNSSTKVRVRTAGHGAAGSFGALAVGDHVIVLGTGTGEPTANRIVEILK